MAGYTFDNVQLLIANVSGPGDATQLITVSGVALIELVGTQGNWHRVDVTFPIPRDASAMPLIVGNGFRKGTVIAFPATLQSTTGADFGWGIDSASIALDAGSGQVVLTAKAIVRNQTAILHRMGFQVSILASIHPGCSFSSGPTYIQVASPLLPQEVVAGPYTVTTTDLLNPPLTIAWIELADVHILNPGNASTEIIFIVDQFDFNGMARKEVAVLVTDALGNETSCVELVTIQAPVIQ